MEYREAISILKTWRVTGDKEHEALNMAISALEKQIPKKPTVPVDTWLCPSCGESVEYQQKLGDNVLYHGQHDFCPRCGQAIDWKGRVMIKNITQHNFGTLAICAIRYCHGRQTYMPSLVCQIIAPHLPEVSDTDLEIMIKDCDFQEEYNLYGDEMIDKPGWILWKELLIAEKGRRTSDG